MPALTNFCGNHCLLISGKPDVTKFSILAPTRPPGGHMYMFSPERASEFYSIRFRKVERIYKNLNFSEDYTADCYNWSQNGGWHHFPKKAPKVSRRQRKILTAAEEVNGDDRFSVYLHKLYKDDSSPLLVHYVGDEKVFEPRCHGNEKKNKAREFFSTAPSVREAIKQIDGQPAQLVYQTMRSKSDARTNPAYGPRNLKQVSKLAW